MVVVVADLRLPLPVAGVPLVVVALALPLHEAAALPGGLVADEGVFLALVLPLVVAVGAGVGVVVLVARGVRGGEVREGGEGCSKGGRCGGTQGGGEEGAGTRHGL